MNRITHKQVEAACARYNAALKLHYWRGKKRPTPGYLMWQDIRGDGRNIRGLYAIANENGGVRASDLRESTMRKTIRAIDLAIKAHKSEAFCLIIRATSMRGAEQKAALREMHLRGLWLSEDQKVQAGLIRRFKTYERHGFVISRSAGSDAPWSGWRDGQSFRADTLKGAFEMAREAAQC